VASSTSRLCLAPDVRSDAWGTKANGTAPLPRLVTGIDAEPVPETVAYDFSGRPTHHREGADMQKSTRGRAPADSRPSVSGVIITPPTYAGPVTTTHTAA